MRIPLLGTPRSQHITGRRGRRSQPSTKRSTAGAYKVRRLSHIIFHNNCSIQKAHFRSLLGKKQRLNNKHSTENILKVLRIKTDK